MTVVVRQVGTDDRARRWRYVILGPRSFPTPWRATAAGYGVFLGLALPVWFLLALLLQWWALPGIAGSILPLAVITRRVTSLVSRDRPVRHHLATAAAEISGRRPAPATRTTYRLTADLLERQ